MTTKSNSAEPNPAANDISNIAHVLSYTAERAAERGIRVGDMGIHNVPRELFDAMPIHGIHGVRNFESSGQQVWAKDVAPRVVMYTNEPPACVQCGDTEASPLVNGRCDACRHAQTQHEEEVSA